MDRPSSFAFEERAQDEERMISPLPTSLNTPRTVSPSIPQFKPYDPSNNLKAMTTAGPVQPRDIQPRLPGHSMSDLYHPPARPAEYTRYEPQIGRPRENVRYEPYDRRRVSEKTPARDEKIVLPPPSMALRLPHDPYAARHVLPSIQQNSPAWEEPPTSRVALPSLRSISGESSPITRPAPYDQPYRPNSPNRQYRPYDRNRPIQPYPQNRRTHPPPHDDSPIRVKYEPDVSPPLRSAPRDERYYPAQPQRYSPARVDYPDRRGSIGSGREEGKEQVVGQTRRLAHLMSEQKRRESINTGFTALRSVLPTALPTDSKAIILRKALARIEQLERAAGIVPAPGRANHMADFDQSEIIMTPSTSRPDWRTVGTAGIMRHAPQPQMPLPRHEHRVAPRPPRREDGRYPDEWYEEREREYRPEPVEYRQVQEPEEREYRPAPEPEEREKRWVEEEEVERESVYSEEGASSRGSQRE